MYVIKFTNRAAISFSPTEATKLGRGATASVYKVKHLKQTFAVKLFTDVSKFNLKKIKDMIALGEEIKQQGETDFFQLLAWPQALVEHNGKTTGFAMPVLDPTEFVGLDSFFDYNLRHNLPNASFKSLSLLCNLIVKFADILTFLHEKNIHVVDLKPQNIKVSKKDLSVHILDCDGFSIWRNNLRHPAELISTDYIAPETIRGKASPKSLGESQDRYAFAVLIFQLLNKGIHPFQGIITKTSIELNTNDEKAEAGLYAYSAAPDPQIKPHPRSAHTHFPSALISLFDQAFTANSSNRPSAKKWQKYFFELTSEKRLKRCPDFPKDSAHIHFHGSECIECYLQGLKTSTTWETKRPVGKRVLPSSPSSKPRPRKQAPPASKEKNGHVFAWVFCALIFLWLINL